MTKKCSVILKDGTPCGKISRGAAGLCHKHGGGKCRIEGCGKPARRAGRLCIDHCGERGAAGEGGAQRKIQKSSGFVGKRAAAKARLDGVAGLTAKELLSAGVWFLESYKMDDFLKKAEMLRYLEDKVAGEPGEFDKDAALDIKDEWRGLVANDGKEAWQIVQMALSACEGYPKRLPRWAKKPARDAPLDRAAKRPVTEWQRVFNVLAAYDVSLLQPAVTDVMGENVPEFFVDEWDIWKKRGDEAEQRPVPLPVRLCAEGCPPWLFLRAAYRCHQLDVHAPPGEYARWARPPTKRVDHEHDAEDGGPEQHHEENDGGEAQPPTPVFPIAPAFDSDDEYAGCFDDAEVVRGCPLEAGDVPLAPADLDAEAARLTRIALCLDEERLEVVFDNLAAEGINVSTGEEHDGNIDIEALSVSQLAVLSRVLHRALFESQKRVPSSEPLFRWPGASAKVDSPGKAEEPSEPPAKRARTPEEESLVMGCPEVLANDAAGERCARGGLAADVDEDLLAVIDQCWGSSPVGFSSGVDVSTFQC